MLSNFFFDEDHGYIDPETFGPSTRVKFEDPDCACNWEELEEEDIEGETASIESLTM